MNFEVLEYFCYPSGIYTVFTIRYARDLLPLYSKLALTLCQAPGSTRACRDVSSFAFRVAKADNCILAIPRPLVCHRDQSPPSPAATLRKYPPWRSAKLGCAAPMCQTWPASAVRLVRAGRSSCADSQVQSGRTLASSGVPKWYRGCGSNHNLRNHCHW